MVDAISAGATIGFVALVLFDEFELKICRLCTCFWISVVYCLFSGNWIGLGLVNLFAHLSYLTLHKVAYYDPNILFSSGSQEPIEENAQR